MNNSTTTDWRKEFGLEDRNPPEFFSGKDQIGRSSPLPHVLRRAFEQLELDGVLCSENSPLIYFRRVTRITSTEVFELHRQFWNHGGASILVLISPDRVDVYSGMSRPVAGSEKLDRLPSLVKVIDRVATALREFVISVESGEFFRENAQSFNPDHRVDRDLLSNLQDTREKLAKTSRRRLSPQDLDALLCRLVFTCYLFDREVIGQKYLETLGFKNASHLRDILGMQPTAAAKSALYRLFGRLGDDFNGDLFSDKLDAEAKLIDDNHLTMLHEFFTGTTVSSGQRAFWPYDFGIIPIETISAIYERFLKESDEQVGAFYTPRFLAEIVLDEATRGVPSLLGSKYLDPACGSGIFLVGLFNRMAEEWTQLNPTAKNDRRARELIRLLRTSLFGVDINPTACRITAFSLYLAYLDQLAPRDIQELQKKGRALPRLVASANSEPLEPNHGNIFCADFFITGLPIPQDFALVIGNPPWGSTATDATPAGRWCAEHQKPLPDKQIAAAFVWKAAQHVAENGRVCFVLPHGTLFHFSTTALAYQKAWLTLHTVERVLNLADFRWFLFEKAVHPAVVVSYRKLPPEGPQHPIEYWAPKADWTITQAELITVAPADRSVVSLGDVLQDLSGPDAPQIWKQRLWATPRDLRFLDRLSLYSRLRDHVRGPREAASGKPWLMAEGFQPFGHNDPESSRKTLTLPGRLFVPARSKSLDLFLLEHDCEKRPSSKIEVRRHIRDTDIFRAPHVLVAEGFTSVAYADFDVSFQDALRGIHGPKTDANLLMFLAAYLRSPLANYFLFHTSSSWGVARPKVQVQELLRLPMPFPAQQSDPKRCAEIVNEVAKTVKAATRQCSDDFVDRPGIIRKATIAIEPLIEEYFDVLPTEKILIEDTVNVTIPSIQPTRRRMPVETVKPTTSEQREAYCDYLCEVLNGWSKGRPYEVRGRTLASGHLGIAMTILEKVRRSDASLPTQSNGDDLLEAFARLREAASRKRATLDPARGLMLFDRNRLYVVKPIGQRHWTQTAALNDADEIAGTILMQSPKDDA